MTDAEAEQAVMALDANPALRTELARVHGGMLVLSEAMFRAARRLGMLVVTETMGTFWRGDPLPPP